MLRLTSEEIVALNSFCYRKLQEKNHSILSLYGCLNQIDRVSCTSVYADHRDPDKATIFIATCKTLNKELLEIMISKNNSQSILFSDWIKESNLPKDEEFFDGLVCWSENFDETSKLLLHKFVAPRKNNLNLYAMKYDIAKSIIDLGNLYENTLEKCTYANPVYLKDNLVEYSCPDGFELKPLTFADAQFALSKWKHKAIDVNLPLRLLSTCVNGYAIGAYDKATSQLASWVFLCWDGSMSNLGTLEEYRGKGLAKSVVSKLSAKLKNEGLPVYACVEPPSETISIAARVFLQLGFIYDATCSFHWSNYKSNATPNRRI